MRFTTFILIASLVAFMASCGSSDTNSNQAQQEKSGSSQDFAAQGKLAVAAAQKKLKTNLVGAMKKDGPLAAIKFCNLNADPIMAEMSKELNVSIKRVSNKNRNTNNSPSERERSVLELFQKEMDQGKKNIEGRMVDATYYAPIMTGGVCLTCHGAKENLAPEVASTLTELYPNDLAIGYSTGELRGAWVVSFTK